MPAKKNSGSKAAKKATTKPAAKPAKKASKSSGKKATKSTAAATTVSEPTPAPTTTPAPEPVVEQAAAAPVADSGTELETLFSNFNKKLAELRSLESSLISDFKKLQKATTKHLKEVSKRNKKRRVQDPNKAKRPPSGFAKPTPISDELCQFLSLPTGTEMARTEVTKHLTTYIKDNNLQDENNKRKIVPDSALQKLLGVSASDEVTYFNLQKYMKVHFPSSKSNSTA
jgi:chromatin remodeling complex protein RSC6